MCGFAGFLSRGDIGSQEYVATLLTAMGDTISHRGPDSSGVWSERESGVGLVHRRLAIVDLTAAGHQPMLAPGGRYVLVFNGEIYNHLSIRSELEQAGVAPAWLGHSDTETLLTGFLAWGVETTLTRCIGMFSIALWDRELRQLTLARDRMGEKPLYYGWQGLGEGAVFLFGSELKALKAHPAFKAPIDRGALALLMRHNYVPAPYSIHQGIAKLEPGSLLTVSLANPQLRTQRFWDLEAVVRAGMANRFAGTPEKAVDVLEVLAKDAIRQEMMADVPLGAFLSGGIDSSTVVALMQSQSSRPVKTFTIGFNEEGYNEAVHAKAVAAHLGTDHTELYVTPEQAMAVIPRLPQLYCEPFADSSQIPTFLVSELARSHVTVSLSGDAGDELFCGYSRYLAAQKEWRLISAIPLPIRRLLASISGHLSPHHLQRLAMLIPGSDQHAYIAEKLAKGLRAIGSRDIEGLYSSLISQITNPCDWVLASMEPPTRLTGLQPAMDGISGVDRMMLLDAISYLPDDILVKVDRASMGASLEARVPFLDHRVVEFAWTLPLDYKLRDGQSKWLLRQVLYRYVPRELIDRPKRGFAVPLHDWLRGPLRDWTEQLLDAQRLEREGYFNVAKVRQAWAEHLSGRHNWTPRLWTVLMFQSWLEEQGA